MEVLVYQDPVAQKVAVVIPAPKEQIEANLGRPISAQQYKDIVYEHSILRPIQEGTLNPQIEVKEIDAALLPTREFRDAWVLEGDVIVEDLEKAKVIKLQEVRAEREPLLQELDKQFMQAIERGDDAERARVIAEKQKLRDVTEPLKGDAVKSVDELRGKKIEDFLNAR